MAPNPYRQIPSDGTVQGAEASDLNRLLMLSDLPTGTGNLSGTLTAPKLPRASAIHTLVDSNYSDHGVSTTVDLQTNIGAGINGLGGLDGLNINGAGASGFVGITNLPSAGVASVGYSALFAFNGGTGDGPPFFSFYWDNGVPGASLPALSADEFGFFNAYAWDGSAYGLGATIGFSASEDWSATPHHGTNIDLTLASSGSGNLDLRFFVHGDGSSGLIPQGSPGALGFNIDAPGTSAGAVVLKDTKIVQLIGFPIADSSGSGAGVAIGSLPGSPVLGMIGVVNNALAPAVGSAVASGGAAKALVWWNGTQWTVMGI